MFPPRDIQGQTGLFAAFVRGGGIGLRLFEVLAGAVDLALCCGKGVEAHELTVVGSDCGSREWNGAHLESTAKKGGNAGSNDLVGEGMAFIATNIEIGGGIGSVIGPGDALAKGVQFAWDTVEADLMGLKDRADGEVFLLRDGVGHVVVAFCATDRDTEECLEGVLHGVFHPLLAGEELEIPCEEAGGTKGLGIFRSDLIRGEHLGKHAVIRLVRVGCLNDPVAPPPDMGLGIPHLIAVGPSRPIAVAPDVHPVPRPALAVTRISEQSVDKPLVGVGPCVLEVLPLFIGRRIESDEVHIDPTQQDFAGGLGARLQTLGPVGFGEEGINGISRTAFGNGGAGDRLKRAPSVTGEEPGEFGGPARSLGQCRCRGKIPEITRLMTQQEFQPVWNPVAVRILISNPLDSISDIDAVAIGPAGFPDLAQAGAEGVVGKFLQRFGQLVVAGKMTGPALGQRTGKEPVEMPLEGGPMDRGGRNRPDQSKQQPADAPSATPDWMQRQRRHRGALGIPRNRGTGQGIHGVPDQRSCDLRENREGIHSADDSGD